MGKRLNRNGVIAAIARLDDFTSHTKSMRGEWQGEIYVVYSYNQWIGQTDGTHWNLNDQRYSVATSRHQSYLRRAISAHAINTQEREIGKLLSR
jgi:hypothetical protein